VPTKTTAEYTHLTQDSAMGQFVNQQEGDKHIPDGPVYKLTRVKE